MVLDLDLGLGLTADQQQYVEGLVAVFFAIIFFGTFALPVKSPAVVRAKVDPAVFQLYYSVAVFVSSWLILVYVEFEFTWWGTVGALLWFVILKGVPSNILALNAIGFVGMALAQGTWSGVTILVSFFWGTFIFSQPVNNWFLCALGLLLLIVGIAGISLANMRIVSRYLLRKNIPEPKTVNGDDDETTKQYEEETDDGAEKSASMSPRQKWIIGMSCCLLLGLLNGSMMAPTHFSSVTGIAYLYSFAIGVAIVTPVIFVIYAAIYFAKTKSIPQFHFKVAIVLPALLAGFLWNVGNYFSIYATLLLGMAIGFPLTQIALVVAGIWGMLLFKEIESKEGIIQFFIAAGVLLVGGALLAFFG